MQIYIVARHENLGKLQGLNPLETAWYKEMLFCEPNSPVYLNDTGQNGYFVEVAFEIEQVLSQVEM
jgi:hypothetical protein